MLDVLDHCQCSTRQNKEYFTFQLLRKMTMVFSFPFKLCLINTYVFLKPNHKSICFSPHTFIWQFNKLNLQQIFWTTITLTDNQHRNNDGYKIVFWSIQPAPPNGTLHIQENNHSFFPPKQIP